MERSLLKLLLGSWALSRLLVLAPLLGHRFPQVLLQWDTVHYLAIAQHGSQGPLYAFFPLFPALLGALSQQQPPGFLWLGCLVSNLAFLGALPLLHAQAQQLWGPGAARWTVLLTCFNPFSLFCAIPYTEGLYLLLTAGALAQGGLGPWAGPCGALAAATRPTGILLLPGQLLQGLREPSQRRQALLAAALTGLGFGVGPERQVDAHLRSPLERGPGHDRASRARVEQMKQDDAGHGEDALAAGAAPMPAPVKALMRAAASVMTTVAHRV